MGVRPGTLTLQGDWVLLAADPGEQGGGRPLQSGLAISNSPFFFKDFAVFKTGDGQFVFLRIWKICRRTEGVGDNDAVDMTFEGISSRKREYRCAHSW